MISRQELQKAYRPGSQNVIDAENRIQPGTSGEQNSHPVVTTLQLAVISVDAIKLRLHSLPR